MTRRPALLGAAFVVSGSKFKCEVKCNDGVGATWRRERKEEFRSGPCKVMLEATREEFKEEVKCEGR